MRSFIVANKLGQSRQSFRTLRLFIFIGLTCLQTFVSAFHAFMLMIVFLPFPKCLPLSASAPQGCLAPPVLCQPRIMRLISIVLKMCASRGGKDEEKTGAARSFGNASERLGRGSGFEQIGTHSTNERRMQDDELFKPVEFCLPVLIFSRLLSILCYFCRQRFFPTQHDRLHSSIV